MGSGDQIQPRALSGRGALVLPSAVSLVTERSGNRSKGLSWGGAVDGVGAVMEIAKFTK